MAKNIYAVYDEVAQDIVGGLFVFTHDSPAVRIFVDGLGDVSTMLAKHPDDYSLICLGEIVEGVPPLIDGSQGCRTVLTGTAWKSARAAEQGND